MRDYSDAPEWATEAFFIKGGAPGLCYYGNSAQFIHNQHLKKGYDPTPHTADTLRTICGEDWWREPINVIVENE